MTSKTTITEALQELKTLDKRIASTRDFIVKYGIRQGSTIDPLDDEGGSDKVIPAKAQSLDDLFIRRVQIRNAINRANDQINLTVSGITRTVAEWIIWRRDVQRKQLEAYELFQNQIIGARRQCVEKGMSLKDDGTQPARVTEVSSFIGESSLQKKIEALREIESTLDGKLSVINATTLIEI